jgi:hypothetical protein
MSEKCGNFLTSAARAELRRLPNVLATTLIFSLILHIQTFDGAFNAPLRRVIGGKGVGAVTKRIDLVTDDLALAAGGSDGIGCRAEVAVD